MVLLKGNNKQIHAFYNIVVCGLFHIGQVLTRAPTEHGRHGKLIIADLQVSLR